MTCSSSRTTSSEISKPTRPRVWRGSTGSTGVIAVGSFSKTLSASIRCGYIALRPDWVEGLIDLKLALSLGNGHLSAALMHRLITDGAYRRHLAEIREKLARAMGETARRLERCGLTLWTEPRGGLFLWARLPDGLDSADIARNALARDVVLAPGAAFSIGASGRDFLRFKRRPLRRSAPVSRAGGEHGGGLTTFWCTAPGGTPEPKRSFAG